MDVTDRQPAAIVIMAREPRVGTAKTRLIPAIGADLAAAIHEAMLLDTLDMAGTCQTGDAIVALDDESGAGYFDQVAPGCGQLRQRGDTFAERLSNAMCDAGELGYGTVVALGTDCPHMEPSLLTDAIEALESHRTDLVLGPADDGGYYLIGWTTPLPQLIEPVPMSTGRVLSDTIRLAKAAVVDVLLLETGYDIDEGADIRRLAEDLKLRPATAPRTHAVLDTFEPTMDSTIVIPALDEETNIGALVSELIERGHRNVIVVDNGSADATSAEATSAGALVISEPIRGYGRACAAGAVAAVASGARVVVFIDADHSSRPSELARLLEPIRQGTADMVLGSRVRGTIDPGAMPVHQRFGNRLSALVISVLYRQRVTDLSPYRAISSRLLAQLELTEATFGWPTEMLVKALRTNAVVIEVPVTWSTRRGGDSKVGGTIKGSVLAGIHILRVIARTRFVRSRSLSR